MAGQRHKKQPTAAQKAGRKARKREVREANHATALTIPGTRTEEKQCLQARRWLLTERDAPLRRFSKPAIGEVQRLFSSDPAIRAANPYGMLSDDAKAVVETVERERDEAKAAGVMGDWWEGERKKKVTEEEVKIFKAGRKMAKEAGLGMEEVLGIGDLGLAHFDHIGYEDDFDDYDDEDEVTMNQDIEGMGGEEERGMALEEVGKEGEAEGSEELGGEDEEALAEALGGMKGTEGSRGFEMEGIDEEMGEQGEVKQGEVMSKDDEMDVD